MPSQVIRQGLRTAAAWSFTLAAPTLLFALLLVLLQPSPAAAGTTLAVCPDGGTYATIQDAVNAAGPGDIIEICPGTYSESVDLSTMGTPGDLTLRATGGVTISGQDSPAIFSIDYFSGSLTLIDINATAPEYDAITFGTITGSLTILGGSAFDSVGAGVDIQGTAEQGVTISGTTFSGNGTAGAWIKAGASGGTCSPNKMVAITASVAVSNDGSGFYIDALGDIFIDSSHAISNNGSGFSIYARTYCPDIVVNVSSSSADYNYGEVGVGFDVNANLAAFVDVTASGNEYSGIAQSLLLGGNGAPQSAVVQPVRPALFSSSYASTTVYANGGDGIEIEGIDQVTLTHVSAISNTGAGLNVTYLPVETLSADSASQAQPTIEDSLLISNAVGIVIAQGGPQCSACAASAPRAVVVPNVHANVICANEVAGLYSSGYYSETLFAAANYWGAYSGPLHGERNTTGDGNRVVDGTTPYDATASVSLLNLGPPQGYVIFAPWVITPTVSVVPPNGLPGSEQSISIAFPANGSAGLLNGPGDPNGGPLFTLATTNGVLSTTFGSGASVPGALANGSIDATLIPATPGLATVSLVGPCGLAAAQTVAVANPALAVTKSPPIQAVAAGGTVTFTIAVTNTGDAPLTNIAADDPLSPSCSRSPGTLPPLAPSAGTSYNCSQSAVAASFTNLITVTAEPQLAVPSAFAAAAATPVTSVAAGQVLVVHPSLALTKTAGTDPDACAPPGPLTVTAGQPIYFCLTVANTGDVVLTDHTLADPQLGIFGTLANTPLPPGVSVAITHGQLPLLGPIVVSGTVTNVATVVSTGIFTGVGAVTVPALAVQAASAGEVRIVLQPTGLDEAVEPAGPYQLYLPTLRR